MAEAGGDSGETKSKALTSPEDEHPLKAFGWAARDSSGELSAFHFSRRAVGYDDVCIKILYCGICHTDIHFSKNEWGVSLYPMVPGHEIVGVVTEFGSKVTNLKVGDRAAVGAMVGSCGTCDDCSKNSESYCPRLILTYNSTYHDGTRTYGGFSDGIVVHQRFVFRFPDSLPLDAGAPLLCAGITVYSPLKSYDLGRPGVHVGVVGLGGLGHLAIKFAKALGAKVTVISTSPSKEEEAIGRLGADAFIISRDEEQIKAAAGTMDGIIDTVSAEHPLLPLIKLLKTHGKLILAGAPKQPFEIPALPLLFGGTMVIGTVCGGTTQTQEMLDFAVEHNITADIELISMDYVMTALERLAKGDVKYRFVIDVANTLKPTT